MFHYVEDQLQCEGVKFADIYQDVGSPVYVYSAEIIRQNLQAYLEADPDALFAYALKANQNLEILKLIESTGFGADVTSGGELFLALEAGFEPHKIIYSGVGKRDEEIRMALKAGISAIHVESPAELFVIEQIAAEIDIPAPVGIRFNPDVNAKTHPYISTGLLENKFGVPMSEGVALMSYAMRSSYLSPQGIAMHIGSQIRELGSFVEAAQLIADLAVEMRSSGIRVEYIDLGGGLGIDYMQPEIEMGAAAENIRAWVRSVGEPARTAGFKVKAEPGRSIVGEAGALLCQVIFTKNNGAKRFVIVDGGMNDLMRPPLYKAHHPILPILRQESKDGSTNELVDVVGPICESSDFLGKDRPLAHLQRSDLLSIMHTGAYGFAMSSNYNGRVRAAEVLVDGDSYRVIRARQTYADLLN